LTSKRKICVVTATRAEYGLLAGLMRAIKSDSDLQLQIIATGTHLSPEHGLTRSEIENDGFVIDKMVPMPVLDDTPTAIGGAIGTATSGFADALAELTPDVLVLLGDRFELLAVISAAVMFKVPLAHIHGGEVTRGAVDDSIRHAVTKMSHLHFTSTEVYRRRVIQMGEDPARVINAGALGVANIKQRDLMSEEAVRDALGVPGGMPYGLVTYHPATLEKQHPVEQIQCLLTVLTKFQNIFWVFTGANADPGGRAINQAIDEHLLSKKQPGCFHMSLGAQRYLSALQYAVAAIGNSSSGIIETPVFKLPTVNIGSRQDGRVRCANVVDTACELNGLKRAIAKALDPQFKRQLVGSENPYEKSDTAGSIKQILKTCRLDMLVNKRFHDAVPGSGA